MKKTLLLLLVFTSVTAEDIKNNIINIQREDSSILVDLKYSTTDNFIGKDVYGDLDSCYLQKEATNMLIEAQKLLKAKDSSLSLLVYDGLRPRNVQWQMWEVVKGTAMQKYVANPERGSIHNYGCAVDLTIADTSGIPLDMGTAFDYFGELAQPKYEKKFIANVELTAEQIGNRSLLRDVMTTAGFTGISIEWWHFNAFSVKEVRKRFPIVEMIGESKK